MGNKILTLFDIEFKKIQKIFFTIILLLILGNIAVFITAINNAISEVGSQGALTKSLTLLNSDMGRDIFLNRILVEKIYPFTNMFVALALFLCAIYSVLIWHRDFVGKSKSIYTLFMLPENKFIIFISKLITMLVLVYSVIFTQFSLWSIGGVIASKLTNIPIINMIEVINTSHSFGFGKLISNIYPLTFLFIFIIGPIVGVSAIFTSVLLFKSKGKIRKLISILYLICLMVSYLIVVIGERANKDIALRNNMIFYIVVLLISLYISYISLNKRIYD